MLLGVDLGTNHIRLGTIDRTGKVLAFRREYPDVKLELVELLTEAQPVQLRNDRIQIGLSRLIDSGEPPSGLEYTHLFDDPFVAAVPMQHPLARRKNVTLAQLEALPLISFPKDRTSGYASHVQSLLRERGARPRIGHEAIEIHTALGLVAAGPKYHSVTHYLSQNFHVYCNSLVVELLYLSY